MLKRQIMQLRDDEFDVPQEITNLINKPFTAMSDGYTTFIVPTSEKPIKIAYESDLEIKSVDDYTIEVERPLTDAEKQELIDLINNVKWHNNLM